MLEKNITGRNNALKKILEKEYDDMRNKGIAPLEIENSLKDMVSDISNDIIVNALDNGFLYDSKKIQDMIFILDCCINKWLLEFMIDKNKN